MSELLFYNKYKEIILYNKYNKNNLYSIDIYDILKQKRKEIF